MVWVIVGILLGLAALLMVAERKGAPVVLALEFKGDKLKKVSLCESHPYAADLRLCLQRLLTELT